MSVQFMKPMTGIVSKLYYLCRHQIPISLMNHKIIHNIFGIILTLAN